MAICGGIGMSAEPVGFERFFPLPLKGTLRPAFWRQNGVTLGAETAGAIRRPVSGDGIAVAFDGVLFDAPDLAVLLAAVPGAAPGDLIARAYGRWGLDFCTHLDGEFAFALWDGPRRRLILGRDGPGTRPLFFWQGDGIILFASSVGALHRHPQVPRAIDAEALARHLTHPSQIDPATLFKGIGRVLPGHVWIAEDGLTRQHRWWRPEELPRVRFAKDADYADALRERLERAVSARLPASGGVAVALSGGLDSTALAALAARRLKAQGRRLTALTLVPADRTVQLYGHTADETALARQLVDSAGNMDHLLVPNETGRSLFDFVDEAAVGWGFVPARSFGANNFRTLWARAAQAGCTVGLTGVCGNFGMSYHGLSALATLLRHGRVAAWAELWPGLRRAGVSRRAILNHSFGPFLPANLRAPLVRLGSQKNTYRIQEMHGLMLLHPHLARRAGVEDHLARMIDSAKDPAAFRLRRLQGGEGAVLYQGLHRRLGLQVTDPTGDRRVVEFCLTIPEEQFILKGEPRSLLRRAMRGLVPDAILDSRQRGLQAADRFAILSRQRSRIQEELARMEKSPLVNAVFDLPRMRRLADTWPDGGSATKADETAYGFGLAQALAVGHFLRRFEGGNG